MEKLFRFYVPEKMWAWLAARKAETNTSVAEIIRAALRDHIRRYEKQKWKEDNPNGVGAAKKHLDNKKTEL